MLIAFYEIEEIVLEVLENEINFAFLFEGLFDVDHVVSFEHFQHFYLSLDCFS